MLNNYGKTYEKERKKERTESGHEKVEASTSTCKNSEGSGEGDFVTKKDLEQLVSKLLSKQPGAKHSSASRLASNQNSGSEDNNSNFGSSGSESYSI